MNKRKIKNLAYSRWIIPLLISIFLILIAGTVYVAFQYFYTEPTAEQVFPKYSQPKDMATAELEQQLQIAIQRHDEVVAFLIYRVAITNVTYTEDKNTALLWLALYDKDTDTLVPAEPGLAIAQRSKDKTWIVTVQPDEGFNKLLLSIPESLIDVETREQYLSKPQTATKGVALRGYRLPWKKGTTKFLTGSIGHVFTYKSCPSSCLYAFDFADGGNFPILASKGGRVKYAVWKYPDNNHTNANYIILEDDTTTPTTYQVYYHLSQGTIPEALRVKGTWVNQGQFIGNVDNTGYSTGPHLHFHVHANPTSFWGNSVDIVFEDVPVNGGRPRTCAEAKAFPSYGSECIPGDRYLSQNGDSKPPTGVMSAPAANTVVSGSTVTVNGYGTDESGVAKIQPMVNYDGIWRPAGEAVTGSAIVTDVDLCAAGVPDGPVSIGLHIWDNGGNKTINPVGEVIIQKKYACPMLPPACTPAANQAALYNNTKFQGYCQVIDIGDIADLATLESFGGNNLESIQLGGGVSAILFDGENFTGRSQTLTASSEDLGSQIVGANKVSSLTLSNVVPPPSTPQPNPVTGPDGKPPTTDNSIVLSWQPSIGALQYSATIKGQDGFEKTLDWQDSLSFSVGNVKAGAYEWIVTARNSAGEKSTTSSFTVQPSTGSNLETVNSPYEAEFSQNVSGWQSNGMWKHTGFTLDSTKHTGWIFGSDGNYGKDSAPVSGELTSPPISIGYAGQQLSFQYASYTESSGNVWDQRRVQISVDGGAFQDILQVATDPRDRNLHDSKPVDLSPYAGKNIRIRFRFDSLDGNYNEGLAWAIKTVRIIDDPAKVCSEYADDGTFEKARDVKLGGSVDAQICPAGDVDFFSFTVDKKQSFSAAVTVLSDVESWTPSLVIMAQDGSSILAEGRINGSTVSSSTTLPEAGRYYLKVGGQFTGKGTVPGVDYKLSLVQDTIPPTVKMTKPADGGISLNLPIELAADAVDSNGTVVRVEFLLQPAGVNVEGAERVAVDEMMLDGWTGTIPEGYPGKLEGSAIFARAYDEAGNYTDSSAILLAGDGTIPVTHMNALPAEYGSTLIHLTWSSVSKEPVDHFELQYQINDGKWQPWAEALNGSLRATSFFAKNGTSYGFRIRAVTASGAEDFPENAQVRTTIEAQCVPDKFETKDNLPSEATPLDPGNGQLHNLCGLKDEDWSVMLLQGGTNYTFKSLPTELAAGVGLQIFDMTGQAMTDEAVPDDLHTETTLNFRPDTSATYILRARAANDQLAGTRSIYSISYDQAAPFSPIPVACGALLIPLLTALVKMWNRLRSRLK